MQNFWKDYHGNYWIHGWIKVYCIFFILSVHRCLFNSNILTLVFLSPKVIQWRKTHLKLSQHVLKKHRPPPFLVYNFLIEISSFDTFRNLVFCFLTTHFTFFWSDFSFIFLLNCRILATFFASFFPRWIPAFWSPLTLQHVFLCFTTFNFLWNHFLRAVQEPGTKGQCCRLSKMFGFSVSVT